MENKEKVRVGDFMEMINYCIDNPEEFNPVYLNMWAINFLDIEYDYTIEDCCRCYNEDTHSHMPLDIFMTYISLFIMRNMEKNNETKTK